MTVLISDSSIRRFFLILATSCVFGGMPVAEAQDLSKEPEAIVVGKYLKLALSRKWKSAAALIEPESLVTLRDSYAKRIVRKGITVEQEEAMVAKLGKSTPEEVARMAPVDFYAAYNTALQERFDVTEEALRLIAKSLKLRVLSIAREGENLAHVLLRTSHRDHRNYVSNLELISLKKINGKWMVALNEQTPTVIPLDEIDPVVRKKPLPK